LQMGGIFWRLRNEGEHAFGGRLGSGEDECSLCIRLVSESVTQPASPNDA
jgi:hypothetical protein